MPNNLKETNKDYCKVFWSSLAETIEKQEGKAKFITANKFLHIDNPISFLEGVRILLSGDDGVFSLKFHIQRSH